MMSCCDMTTWEAQLDARQRPAGRPALRMCWEELLFLHWQWSPEAIQRTLPAGLQVDTFEGKAWLGIVPFFMNRVHPVGLPCVPWLSWFLELNVRTYVRNAQGVPGVWFYSLGCNQPLAVEIARRFFHLNYVHAQMHATRNEDVQYTCRRQEMESVFRYSGSDALTEAVPGSLEFFLVERYVLYSQSPGGHLFQGRVFHFPYKVGAANVLQWDFRPAALDGFADPGRAADHILYASKVDVEAWPLVPDRG